MVWIRSQDGKILSNVNNMYVRVIGKGYAISSDKFDLGTYSTEEKAMEVMNMIHRRIECAIKFYETSSIFSNESEYVFNMPKDDEV